MLSVCVAMAACRTAPAPRQMPAPVVPGVGAGIEHFAVDSEQSQVLVLVYRDGPMARLGHNHVISVRALSGDVTMTPDVAQASFSLEFPVAAMSIDDPALRAQLGDDFKTTVDATSIDGTRSHVLGDQLLDAVRYPSIRLKSERLRANADQWLVTVHVTVRDHDSTVEVPMSLTSSPEQLSASGEFDLSHAQLGLTPYSVALGALRVAETIHVRYALVARRSDTSKAGTDTP